MKTHIPTRKFLVRRPQSWAIVTVCSTALLGIGCQSQPPADERAPNPSLRHIAGPQGSTQADLDRACLVRFIGVWNFQGWSAASGASHAPVAGRAAATIENAHFVLIDLQMTSGQLGERMKGKGGSMLLASEPGIGVTLTAWGEASPSISRLVGRAEGNGSVFPFTEMRTPGGMHRLSMTLEFVTDDRWTADIRDWTASENPVVGHYEFTRASN